MKVDIFNTDKKYSIIYADPPWEFSSKQLQKVNGTRFHSLNEEYITTSTKSMCAWGGVIDNIVTPDSAIFMWSTDAHLKEAITLMEAWGFKYKTVAFVWSKHSNKGNELFTLGAWTMKNCELCLLGTKGRMLQYKKANNVLQLCKAERTRHSQKPSEIRDRIVNLFGDIPRIELFARQHADGWDCWGNEV